MSQSQKQILFIKPLLLKQKPEAIDYLSKLNIKDIAIELYDLNQNYEKILSQIVDQQEQKIRFKNAATQLLTQLRRKFNAEELEKVIQNDQDTINMIFKRVPHQEQQVNYSSEDKQNIIQLQKKIYFYEDYLNQIQTDKQKLFNINQELLEQLNRKNDAFIKYEQQQQKVNAESQIVIINSQLEIINEKSQNIDDYEQYRERIYQINKERDELIKKLKDTIVKFEQIQSQSIPEKNYDINQSQYQDNIDQMKDAIMLIDQMTITLSAYTDQLELDLQNQNQANAQITIIKNITTKLKKNQECFIYIKIVFEATIKILEKFKDINTEQSQKNRQLQERLKELQSQNLEFKNTIQNQINELQEHNKKEEENLFQISINSLKGNLHAISRLFSSCDQFNDQIMQELKRLSNIILILFPIENQQANVQSNQEILDKIKSFINSIREENENNGTDSQEQQWERSLELFNQIYPQVSNNSLVNQYIRESFDFILKIKRKVQNNKNSVKEQIRIIQGSANQQALN